MYKFLTLILVVLLSHVASAQCDLEVEIQANPSSELCLGESVQLIAVTNQEVEIPETCGIVTSTTCEVGSIDYSADLDDGTAVNAQGASLPDVFGDINEGHVRSQLIYRASELADAGFVGGKIKGMQLEIASINGDANIPNVEIQIGCVSESDFSGNAFITAGLNTVFDNKAKTLNTGFTTFDFDRGYNWNGTDNLVVQICISAPSGDPGNFKIYTRDQFLGFSAIRVARTILAQPDCDFSDNVRNSSQRPNTRFLTCKPELKDFNYTWTPVATLDDASARAPFANPTVNTTYNVEVFENINPGCVATDQITVTVVDPGDFTPTANTPLCEGSSLILNSNKVADSYLWIGPDGFTNTNANPVINNVGLNNAGTYTVFVDVGFCKANKTVDVEVEQPLNSGTALPDPIICNNTTTFNLFDLLDGNETNATSIWTDDDGSGVLTGNTIRPVDIPNASLPQTFAFTYTLGNSCGDQSTTVNITINPAPEAGDDGATTICNNDNTTIDLNNFLGGTPDAGGTWIDFSSTGVLNPGGTVNLFNFSGGSYTFYYKVTGPGACEADSNKVDVTVEEYKVAGNGISGRICRGETINLFDYLVDDPDAGGLWVDVSSSGGLTNPNTGAFNSGLVPPGTYLLNYVIDNPDPCPDETAAVTITVTKKPEIINPTTFCNASETFYQVQFEVRDGDPTTLTADIIANGVNYGFTLDFVGGVWVFTTDLIPEGEEVFIEISDADACGTSTYNIRKRCGCATDAGVINVGPQQTICEGSFYTVNYLGGFINDGDDIFEFILHDNNGSTINNVIDRNRTGTFGYVPGVLENTTYYISVVAGDEIPGTNTVDLNDDCIDIRAGQPVQFISLPNPTLSVSPDTACIGGNVTLSATDLDGVDFEWTGPGVTSTQEAFDIFGLTPGLVGQYDLTISKDICEATFSIDLPAYTVPTVTTPATFIACPDVLDSIPIQITNIGTGSARFQTEDFQILDIPVVNGTNYLQRNFLTNETLTLMEVTYPVGCTAVLDREIDVVIEEAPEITFELASPEIICSAANPVAQVRFNFDPPTASGNIIYEVSGFQLPDEPLIGNDSVISVPAIVGGENIFKIRRYLSAPKGCSYALDFGEISFFNYQEPEVSYDVNNNKICRGDTAYIPISVTASDSITVIYEINGVPFSFTTDRDTLLPITENFDFTFNIDSAFYAGGNGCGKLINLEQEFEVKDPLNFAATPVKNDCRGETDGQILLSADGDNTAFSLDGNTYFVRSSFDNLPSGSYQVFARAESGCISVRTVEIENKSNLDINVNFSPTTCGNVNGSLQVEAVNGSDPYHVLINGTEYNNGLLRSDLNSGTYVIYAYDNLACEIRDTVTIQPSEGVDFSFTKNGPLSCDFPDAGEILVDANGGSGNYVYQLNNQPPQDSPLFTGLFAQYYNVKVIDDQDGCVKEKTVRILPQVPFYFTARILRELKCDYDQNGIVEAIVDQNGTSYLYSLDRIDYSSNKLFTNVGAGQFTLFAKELDGCRREQDFSFRMEAAPPVETDVIYTEDVICWNGTEGVVGLSGFGGNGEPFSYRNLAAGNFKNNPVFTGLGQGLHTFVTKDVEGCLDTVSVRLFGPDTVHVEVMKVDSGNNQATVVINATNTHLTTLYSLDGVNFSTNPVFENLDPGSYTVYIRDQLGCETIYTFELTVTGIDEKAKKVFSAFPNPFTDEIKLQFNENKAVDFNQLQVIDMTGKSLHYEYNRLNSDIVSIRLDQSTKPGIYLIRYQDFSIRTIKK